MSENEGDIIKYCQEIKTKNYAKDIDILFILGGDGTVNELINGVMTHDLQLPIEFYQAVLLMILQKR